MRKQKPMMDDDEDDMPQKAASKRAATTHTKVKHTVPPFMLHRKKTAPKRKPKG